MNKITLEFKTKINFFKFYELGGTANTKSNQKDLKEYRGFCPAFDVKPFMKVFNLPRIRVFKAGKKPGSCFVDYVYKNKDHLRLGDDYKGGFVDVCSVQLREYKLHSGEDDSGSSHVFYLKNVDNLLNLRVCPKCKIYVCQSQRNKQGNVGGKSVTQFNDHVEQCDGKRPKKKLKVMKVEKPFAPGMLFNQIYEYLRSRNMMEHWKPDRYFIVYDLETVEIPSIDKEESSLSNSSDNEESYTKILSELVVLTVSACYYTKEGKKTSFFSKHKDGPEFIKIWLREMVSYAKKVYEDNLYDDPRIPHKREVVIFGYNSARFDTNLIFKNLYNPPEWTISSIIGELCKYKQLTISVPYDTKETSNVEEKETFNIEEKETTNIKEEIRMGKE
jgi:hypothetical protein